MPANRTRGVAQSVEIRLRPMLGRQLAVLALVALGFWVLRERLPQLDMGKVWRTIHQVGALQWIGAAGATIASFWAVGRYDEVVHGLLGTGVAPARARLSGTAAIAVAQFAGFGVLSGALVRWRLLPELSLGQALRLSVAVSLSFLAGWAVVAALAVLLTGLTAFHARPLALAVLVAGAAACLLLLLAPRGLGRLPSLRAFGSVLALALVDTFFAALALYLLLPAGADVAPATVFAAFLVALGAGLIAGTPGGVGPFEVTLLALLPTIDHEPLLASALAFRLVYYLVPAALGTTLLLRGPLARDRAGAGRPALVLAPPEPQPYLAPALENALWFCARAETNLVRQGEFALLHADGRPVLAAAPAGQALVMLGDPLSTSARALGPALAALGDCARRAQRSPLIYKCGARTAAAARARGWKVLAISQEAWLEPATFTTAGREHRQLRRLLRKAEKAGIRVTEGGRCLPLDDMARLSRAWARAHGGERGFSMGRFQGDYVSCQRVFLAWQGDRLVAFITLHENRREWTLDLMRQDPQAPDGTMHLLLCAAINSAAAIFCPRLSLAALPLADTGESRVLAGLRARIARLAGGDGLRRFKTSFAPRWQTLYVAAPGPVSLLLGLAAVLARIRRPGPLRQRPARRAWR